MPRTRKWTRQEGTQTQATWYRPFGRSMCGGWLLALCSSRGSARRSRIQPDAAADARSAGGTTSPNGKDTKVFSSCLVHSGRGFAPKPAPPRGPRRRWLRGARVGILERPGLRLGSVRFRRFDAEGGGVRASRKRRFERQRRGLRQALTRLQRSRLTPGETAARRRSSPRTP